jgi:hypothetical protein
MYLNKLYLPSLFAFTVALLMFMFCINPDAMIPHVDRVAQLSLLSLTIFGLIIAWSEELHEALGRWLTGLARTATTGWFAFLGYTIWLDGGLHW